MNKNKNIPNETGLYFARSDCGYKWYDMIVKVYGDAPFFKINGWKRGIHEVCGNFDINDIEDFGPKIDEPEVPKEIISR